MIPVSKSFTAPLVGDPLFPLATLLPLSDTHGRSKIEIGLSRVPSRVDAI